MQRLFHDQPIPEELRGAIIALGNFDGFHLGHQAVAGRAVQRGAHERRPVIIATFDPHPVRHFRPDTPPFRLTTLDQRQRLFAQAGADAMLVFNFAAELASTTAEDFIAGILADRFGALGRLAVDSPGPHSYLAFIPINRLPGGASVRASVFRLMTGW